MTDKEIAQLIDKEFTEKTFGVTEQYLEIHQPIYKDGQILIDRIDREKDNTVVAYLPVHEEYFFFAIYIDVLTKEIINIGTESRNIVSLIAISEILSSNEIQTFTNLKADESWDKGDLKSNKKSKYTFSGIELIPNPEPDEFEDKLRKLLILLQRYKAGIRTLTANCDAFIKITMDFHGGNQLLGGASLSLENIQILNELNLKVDFDFTARGEPFR